MGTFLCQWLTKNGGVDWKYGNNCYDIIFFGEKHGIKENFETYLKIIKKYNAREKSNIYFEIGISAGIYINEFINGNEIFSLDDFIADFKGTM